MIRLFLRLLQRTWAARRADEDWIRAALSGGETLYTYGIVGSAAGAVLVDNVRPTFPVDLWGALSSPGLPNQPGLRLRFTSGAAAGQAWEIDGIDGREITLIGADLVAEGVAEGDAYRIEDPDHDAAVEWFRTVNCSFSQQFPADRKTLPSVVVRQGGRTGTGFFVGSLWGERREIGADLTELISVSHGTSLMAAAVCLSENEAQWMEAFVIATMMDHTREITGLFQENQGWSISGVNPVVLDGGIQCFGTELTVEGRAHHLHRKILPTVLPQQDELELNVNPVRGSFI